MQAGRQEREDGFGHGGAAQQLGPATQPALPPARVGWVQTEPEDEEVAPEFHPLPHLTSDDVAELLQVARVRIPRFLLRQGAVVETRPLELSDASPPAVGATCAGE